MILLNVHSSQKVQDNYVCKNIFFNFKIYVLTFHLCGIPGFSSKTLKGAWKVLKVWELAFWKG